MRVVLIGPPGAGKGTQAVRLAAALAVPHISTGELLRSEIDRGTQLGEQVRELIAGGGLVPTELLAGLVEQRLVESGAAGFLLDGFPRRVDQAELLDRLLAHHAWELTAAVLLDLPDEEVLRRITGRRVCSWDASHGFHLTAAPPRRPGRCDHCGGPLLQRSDDEPETVLRRQEHYRVETAPLAEYYRRTGALRRVAAVGSVAEVESRLRAALTAGLIPSGPGPSGPGPSRPGR